MNAETTARREQYLSDIADAHNGPVKAPALGSTVLPAGYAWIPHVPKEGPLPERRRRPSDKYPEMFS